MTRKFLSTVPGVVTVCVVGVAAAYLVTHTPPPMQLATPPVPASTSSAVTPAPAALRPAVPSQSAPSTAARLAAPAPPNATVPSPASSEPARGSFFVAPSPATRATAGRDPRGAAPAAVLLGRPEFHVQAGAFKIRENADDLVRQLRANGYTVTVVEGPVIHVWVGPPMSRSAGERLAANLRANGFETTLSPVR